MVSSRLHLEERWPSLVQQIGPVTSLVAFVIVGICGPTGWSFDQRYTGIVFDIIVQVDDTRQH